MTHTIIRGNGFRRRAQAQRLLRTAHAGSTGPVEPVEDPVCLRSFSSSTSEMLWEVPNFGVLGRSPDETLWGWGVRNVTPSGYTRRVLHELAITSGGTMPADANLWPAKTNPSSWAANIRSVAIDLVKVGTDGVRIVTKENYVEYTVNKSSVLGAIGSALPVPLSHNGTVGPYGCNNDGWYLSVPPQINTLSTYAIVAIEDGQIDGDTMRFTIRPQQIIKHASAGSNEPQWNFRRASTTVSFPLYATAAEVVTALEALPGVSGVTATGGPCCVSSTDIVVEWDDPTYTFSHVWVSCGQAMTASRRPIWDLSTGEPVGFLSFSPAGWTSDGVSILRNLEFGVRRVALEPPDEHPWYTTGDTEWTALPFNGMTQTNERVHTGSGFTVVPRSSFVSDVKSGRVLVAQTRSRVPVGEPNTAAMTTHAVIDEASGAVSDTLDCYLNAPGVSLLTDSGELAIVGDQFRYQYQGGIEGIAPPYSYTGTAMQSVFRSFNGRQFTTGTSDLFEPFALEAPQFKAVAEDQIFCVGATRDAENFNWNFSVTGSRSSLEMRLSGEHLCGQWQDFPPGFPVPIVPRHQREYWYCFAGSGWPKVPPDCEFRFSHVQGSSVFKQTAWLPFTATVAELDDELQEWYGEPIAGYPTISISGSIQEHDWQIQPVWQYLPLASIDIWNDATGATFAPRGRVLRLEFRNGTPYQNRSLVAANRTTGVIQWQRDVGIPDRRFTSSSVAPTRVAGQVQYATSTQVTVSTLCKPVLQDDVNFGTCLWEWDGSAWVLQTDNCSEITEAVAPSTPGTTIGQTASGTCALI